MRQHVSDDDHGDSVLDLRDRPHFVAAHIEDRLSFDGVRSGEGLSKLHDAPVVRFPNQLLPTPQAALRVRMLLDELLDQIRAKQPHQKGYSKLRYEDNRIIASCDTKVAPSPESVPNIL